jgi:hypothetical protein
MYTGAFALFSPTNKQNIHARITHKHRIIQLCTFVAHTSEEASVGITSGIKIQVNIKNPSPGLANDICQQFSNSFQGVNTIALQEEKNKQY